MDLNSDPFKIAELMKDFHQPWGFCGGWAIDLYTGNQTRPHKDVDISVLRRHQREAFDYLLSYDWMLEKAYNGKLSPLVKDEYVHLPIHGIWCKNTKHDPNFLELLLNESDDTNFYFRRDLSITAEINKVFIQTKSGLPILTPEIVLLYKSKDVDKENESDFQNVLPYLNKTQKDWLRSALNKLYSEHRWQAQL